MSQRSSAQQGPNSSPTTAVTIGKPSPPTRPTCPRSIFLVRKDPMSLSYAASQPLVRAQPRRSGAITWQPPPRPAPASPCAKITPAPGNHAAAGLYAGEVPRSSTWIRRPFTPSTKRARTPSARTSGPTPGSCRNADLHLRDAMDEVGVDSLRLLHQLDHREALHDLFPEDN
jgi:hypothetical protein